MTNISKKYRLLVLQIILVQIEITYSSHLYQRHFFHHKKDEDRADYRYKDTTLRKFYYLPQSLQMDNNPTAFIRKAKSSNQPRLLNIDLSRLRKDKDLQTTHGNVRHKAPIGLLGIDISVLSRNPDPTLPIAVIHPKNILNGKAIMSYDFDPKYDRLPVIKTKPIQTYFSLRKPARLLPVMHMPLKVMTTYHSILTNKKQDIDFNLDNDLSDDTESEQEYTANFILHLLYELSSSNGQTNSGF